MRKAYVQQILNHLFPLKPGKGRVDKSAGNLAGAIGPEVKKDKRIAVVDHGRRSAVAQNHRRPDKLVVFFAQIGFFHSLRSGIRLLAFAQDSGVIGKLHALPAVVAVHAVVAARHGSNRADANLFYAGFQFFDVSQRTARRNVAAIQKGVDVHLGNPPLLRQL